MSLYVAAILLQKGTAPDWVQVAKVGIWKGYRTSSGLKTITITSAHLKKAVENFDAAAGDRRVIDYEHASLEKAPRGEKNPAAGWVVALETRSNDEELWAKCEWTPTAATEISESQYRYVSPVIFWVWVDPQTGKDIGTFFHSLALTNTPFFEELPGLAASMETGTMSNINLLVALAMLLGLKQDADENTVIASVRDLTEGRQTLAATLGLPLNSTSQVIGDRLRDQARASEVGRVVLNELKAKDDESAEAVIARLRPELAHAGYVPASEVTELKARVAKDQAAALVASALAEGRITPAQQDWLRSYAESDFAAASAWTKVAPKVFGPADRDRKGPTNVGDKTTLTAEEEAIRANLGLSKEDFLKGREA